MNWYLEGLKKYAVTDGRARRKEYWMFILFNFIVAVLCMIVDASFGLVQAEIGLGPIYIVYVFLTFIPHIAVSIRRLHDTDHSGWSLLVSLIPIVGAFILLVWLVRDSDPGKNRFGSNPKRIKGEGKEAVATPAWDGEI